MPRYCDDKHERMKGGDTDPSHCNYLGDRGKEAPSGCGRRAESSEPLPRSGTQGLACEGAERSDSGSLPRAETELQGETNVSPDLVTEAGAESNNLLSRNVGL